MEQAEQQQFDMAWQPAQQMPEFDHGDYSSAQAAYLPTETVQAPSTSYPYRSHQSAPSTTYSGQSQPMYYPTGDYQILSVDLSESVSKVPREWWHPFRFRRAGREIQFKMDTGAHGNVLALRDLYRLGLTEHDLQESHVFLRTFSQDVVQPLGTLVTEVTVNGRLFQTVFHVVPHCSSPLFSF
jgi:hypothetical protein